MFSDSLIFPAKFSGISTFCGHPELLHSRKLNWFNSLSLMPALWRPHDNPPSLNTSTAAFNTARLNALNAQCTHHIMSTSTQASNSNTSTNNETSSTSTTTSNLYSSATRVPSTSTKYYMSVTDRQIHINSFFIPVHADVAVDHHQTR